MFKLVLFSLVLSGLQALPISPIRGSAKTHHDLPAGIQDGQPVRLPDSLREGTEPSRHFIVDLNTGLVQDYISEMDRRTAVEDAPIQRNGGGWVRVEGRATLPDGFRQGTEPSNRIPVGYRQGTERFMPIPSGFKQGTEASLKIPNGFRQGTEPTNPIVHRNAALLKALPVENMNTIPDGFRQGTEPSSRIPEGFRQGTERFMPIPDGFKQGTEPSVRVPDGFKQGTEPSVRVPDGFKQGTEPSLWVPKGFQQGTEPTNPIVHRNVALLKALPIENVNTIPDGFRQGTEPSSRIPEGFRQGTERFMPIPDGFKQGTEPSVGVPDGFKQGTEPSLWVPEGFRQGTEPTNPIVHRNVALLKTLPIENVNTIPDGFRQGTKPSNRNPEGFRQGTERFMPIPDGFKQGTEPSVRVPDGFKQGTEPSVRIPNGFKQGTEPSLRVPNGFRQGTEPSNPVDHRELSQSFNALPAKVKTIQDGFKTGFKPSNQILNDFRPGMGPFMPIRDGERQEIKGANYIPASFRQENELFKSRQESKIIQCEGEIINGRCYTFNPTPLPFLEAQDSCKRMGPNAELASITSEDLHSRLISIVAIGEDKERVMTWLGGMVKNQRASWLDGSEWRYSDWMPGQPNIHTDKPVCVEMFRMGETWWSAADCDRKRASICSYPVVA